MRIVEDLAPTLPEGYVAEPRVHLGSLYAELLALLGHPDAGRGPDASLYAVTCRKGVGRRTKLDTWFRPIAVGRPRLKKQSPCGLLALSVAF